MSKSQEIIFTAIDGELLVGQIDYPQQECQGLVFLIPGAFATDRNGSPLGFPALNQFYTPLRGKILSYSKFAVFNYDRRKTGKSSYKDNSIPVEKDVFSAYNCVSQLFFKKPIFLLGQSYGAGIIKKHFSKFQKISPPKGVLLLSSSGELTNSLQIAQIPIHILIGQEDDPNDVIVKKHMQTHNKSLVSYTFVKNSDHLLCDKHSGYQGWTEKKESVCKMSVIAQQAIVDWLNRQRF